MMSQQQHAPFGCFFSTLLGFLVATAPARTALAGCGDGACGRVDWSEVTDTRQGEPVAAKMHGGFAWESSPDSWGSHPIGGMLDGYLWLSCLAANGSVDNTCPPLLAAEIAKEGTSTPLRFSGHYYDEVAKRPLQPAGLFDHAAPGKRTFYTELGLGGMTINAQVCPTAFALASDRDAGDFGGIRSPVEPDAGRALEPSEPFAAQPHDVGAAPQGPVAPDAGTANANSDPAPNQVIPATRADHSERGSCSIVRSQAAVSWFGCLWLGLGLVAGRRVGQRWKR